MIGQAEPASVAANRELARMFFAEQDRLRGGPAEALCDPSYRAHLGGNPPVDLAGHQAFARAFYAAFTPDSRHDIEHIVASADWVAVRFVIRGTHSGSFFGIPATGKKIVCVANVLMRVSNGKVAELFGVFDEAGILRQMGVLPAA
jgi:predicted ester cyclase